MARATLLPNLTTGSTIALNATVSPTAFACVWGTDPYASSSVSGNSFSGMLIKSIRVAPRNEEIIIEQGSGFEAIQIILKDGMDFEINLVDDLSIDPPATNDVLTFLNPFTGTALATAICIHTSYSVERKVEGTLTVIAKHFALLSVT